MTGDLAKRLRAEHGPRSVAWEAADRIEALEARINYQSELLLGLDRTQLLRIEKLEAALREIRDFAGYGPEPGIEHARGIAIEALGKSDHGM